MLKCGQNNLVKCRSARVCPERLKIGNVAYCPMIQNRSEDSGSGLQRNQSKSKWSCEENSTMCRILNGIISPDYMDKITNRWIIEWQFCRFPQTLQNFADFCRCVGTRNLRMAETKELQIQMLCLQNQLFVDKICGSVPSVGNNFIPKVAKKHMHG